MCHDHGPVSQWAEPGILLAAAGSAHFISSDILGRSNPHKSGLEGDCPPPVFRHVKPHWHHDVT
jgi:hypothetical protein